MIVSTYSPFLTNRSLASADVFPSKDAAKTARVVVAHPVSVEAIAHFSRMPKPTYDAARDRYFGTAPSFTPFDPMAFR